MRTGVSEREGRRERDLYIDIPIRWELGFHRNKFEDTQLTDLCGTRTISTIIVLCLDRQL